MREQPVQIRVHGVAGTEPRTILRTDPDPLERCDLPSGISVLSAPAKPPEGFSELRAFSWTDLTSGKLGQGVRALLAPLLFVNVAGWMLPRFSRRWVGALTSAAIRLAGLATTGVLTIGVVWAVYLAPVTACNALETDVFRDDKLEHTACRTEVFYATWPEWLIMAIIVAVIALLIGLLPTQRRRRRTESVNDEVAAEVQQAGLDWVQRVANVECSPNQMLLGAVHGAFAISVIVASWAVSRGFWTARADAEEHFGEAVDASGANPLIAVMMVVLFLLGLATAWIDPGGELEMEAPSVKDRLVATGVLGLLSGCFVFLLAPRFGTPKDLVEATLAEHFDLVNVVVVAFGVVPLIVTAIAAIFFSDNGWVGARASGVLGMSMLIGGAMSAGLAFIAVLAFDLVKLREAYGGNEHVAFALVIAISLFAAWCLAGILLHPVDEDEDPRSAMAKFVRDRLDYVTVGLILAQLVGWTIGALSAEQLRFVLDWRVSWWLVVASIALPVAFAVLLSQRATVHRGPKLMGAIVALAGLIVIGVTWMPGDVHALKFRVEIVGLIVPLIIFVGLVARWLSNGDSRRGLGAISDLATFWPRSFHPYVPRPYSGTAIAALSAEVGAVRSDGKPVLLAGHSQGSLLATLAVLQQPAASDDEIGAPMALLIYGSPVGHLYHRAFPKVFGDLSVLVQLVEERTVAWVNLHRDTDPIAHRIEGVENKLVAEPKDSDLAADGHSRYEIAPAFKATEHELHKVLIADWR